MNCSHKKNKTIRYLLIIITLTILVIKRKKKKNISSAYNNTIHLPIFDLVAAKTDPINKYIIVQTT